MYILHNYSEERRTGMEEKDTVVSYEEVLDTEINDMGYILSVYG